MKTIYLDNNATTAVAPEVREAMLPYLTDLYGNPSSMHTFGGQVGRAVEEARERMAALLAPIPTRSSSRPVVPKATTPPSGPPCRPSPKSATSSPPAWSIPPSSTWPSTGNARATA